MSSADVLCGQLGPTSGPTKCRACSVFKLFETLMVILKEFLNILILKRNQQTTKKRAKILSFRICKFCRFSIDITLKYEI